MLGTFSEANDYLAPGYKKSWLTQLSIKFFLQINVKMPTIVGIIGSVGILSFMSEKNIIIGLSKP